MFEKPEYKCPKCDLAVGEDLSRVTSFTCSGCGGYFTVSADPQSGHVALFEAEGRRYPEPLWLPKGSVRAFVAMLVAGCFWFLVAKGADVPVFLMSLLLAVIGYYFGFRVKAKAADSRIYDPAAEEQDPLHLPAGCIRGLLTAGFVVTAIVLGTRGLLGEEKYAEFFFILAGLIFGHFFGRAVARASGGLNALVGHLKALVVLASTVMLVALLVTGSEAGSTPLALACVVSFYYGSRS